MKFFKTLLLICLTHFTVEPAAADKCWEHPKEGDQIALISPSSAPSSTATAKAV